MEEQLIKDFFIEEKTHWWHTSKRALIKQFILGKHLTVLIVGIGGGLLCHELKRKGYKVIGVDISLLSCKYAFKYWKTPVIKCELENTLPFKESSFDLIIIADVLEHLNNDQKILHEIHRCLKPYGTVIITVPAYNHLWSLWDDRLAHKRRYCLAELKEKMIKANISLEKLTYYNMMLYPPVYIYRKLLMPFISKKYSQNKSDFAVSSNLLTSMCFSIYCTLERNILRLVNLPFGLSIFAVGINNG